MAICLSLTSYRIEPEVRVTEGDTFLEKETMIHFLLKFSKHLRRDTK